MPNDKKIEKEVKQEKTVSKPEPKAEAKAKEDAVVCYMGPDIPRVTTQGRVYKNGIPAKLKTVVEKIPTLGVFFVPIEKIAQTRLELAIEESYLGAIYTHVSKEIEVLIKDTNI